MSYGEFGELIMKLSRAALRPLLAAHERGALPLVGAAWGVTARKASHRRSPLTRAEPCHWSERRGVSLRERRATMQVMRGVSLRARWDATLVVLNITPSRSISSSERRCPDVSAKSMPVLYLNCTKYVMSFSHLCLGFLLLLFPATIPCIIVFSKPLWRVMWP